MESVVTLACNALFFGVLSLILVIVLWCVVRDRFDTALWRHANAQAAHRDTHQQLHEQIIRLEKDLAKLRQRLLRLENFPFHLDRALVQSMEKQLRQGVLHPAIYHDWCLEHGWDERARELKLWRGFKKKE